MNRMYLRTGLLKRPPETNFVCRWFLCKWMSGAGMRGWETETGRRGSQLKAVLSGWPCLWTVRCLILEDLLGTVLVHALEVSTLETRRGSIYPLALNSHWLRGAPRSINSRASRMHLPTHQAALTVTVCHSVRESPQRMQKARDAHLSKMPSSCTCERLLEAHVNGLVQPW